MNKKLLTIFILFLIGYGLNFSNAANKAINNDIIDRPLKADKSNILEEKDIMWQDCDYETGECIDKGLIKKYVYIDKIADNLPNEDVSKRTENARFIKKEKENWEAIIYANNVFKNVNGVWYQLENATTTIDNFEKQTGKITVFSKIKDIMIKTVLATETSFSSEAGDGYVGYSGSGDSWTTVRNAVSGNTSNYTNTVNDVRARLTGSDFQVRRLFLAFDTSSLGSVVINSATLNATIDGNNSSGGGFAFDIHAAGASQASASELVNDDYDNIARTSFGSDDYSGGLIDESFSIALNASGISNIQTSGITKISLQHENDINNVEPTSSEYANFYMSEETGTAKDPVLVIDYTAAAGGCSYSGSGDWYVNSGDDCYIGSDVYVSGDLNLVNTGLGSFNLIDGVKLMVHKINNTSTPINAETGTKIELY